MKKLLFAIGLILFLILIYLNRNNLFQTDEQYFKTLVTEYVEKKFDGIVLKKYQDVNDHNLQKVILNVGKGKKEILIMNFENEEIFNFIKRGDSLIKKENSLKFRLKRNKLDTILFFKFKNVKDFEKSTVFDSIKHLYYSN